MYYMTGQALRTLVCGIFYHAALMETRPTEHRFHSRPMQSVSNDLGNKELPHLSDNESGGCQAKAILMT
jgi:hypothetical protein